jgi:predicted Zn-dependent protease
MLSRHRRALVALLVVSSVLSGADPNKFKPGFNLFNKQQDIELGREAAAQISKEYTIVRNGELSGYLTRIGQRLASQPLAADYPYTFTLVHENSINAFALPGGPTFVHTGLLLAAGNEAELAGVMAHEIAHVALRHGTNQASKAMGLQLAAGLLGGAVGGGSLLNQLAQAGIAFGANSVLLKYSRDAERQADLMGAHLMAGAGYNPVEMARFFEKLEAEGGARGPQFLSDHPNPGNRVRAVEQEIRTMPRQSYGASSGDLGRLKELVRRLGEPPKKKATR